MSVIDTTGEIVKVEPAKPKKPRTKTTATKGEIVSADKRLYIKEAEAYLKECLDAVSGFKIENQEQRETFEELRTEAKDKRKALDAALKEITAPLLADENAARAAYKPAQNLCDAVVEAVDKALKVHILEQRRAQDAALATVAASGGTASSATLALAHGAGSTESTKTSERFVLKFKIVDEAQIPEKYFVRVLNEKQIQEEIDLTEGKCKIPGIEVYEDVNLAQKPRRA